MARVEPFSKWTKTASGDGIVWRAGDSSTKVNSPAGEKCFRVRFSSPGAYYVTAHSSAPHWSEHNDMWIRFSRGLRLFNAGTMAEKKSRMSMYRYFKAYQNIGRNRKADIISSVNHNPHIMVTSWVETGKFYELCIAGRSSKFTVYDLVMVKCMGMGCKRFGSHIRDAMKTLKYSTCVRGWTG